MTQTMAQNIFQSGFGSFQAIAEASTQDVMSIPGYEDPDKADKLIQSAKDLIEKYEKEGVPVPTSPNVSKETKTNTSSAKEQADQRLKEELQKLQKEE
jgi:N utilization substance protein A